MAGCWLRRWKLLRTAFCTTTDVCGAAGGRWAVAWLWALACSHPRRSGHDLARTTASSSRTLDPNECAREGCSSRGDRERCRVLRWFRQKLLRAALITASEGDPLEASEGLLEIGMAAVMLAVDWH